MRNDFTYKDKAELRRILAQRRKTVPDRAERETAVAEFLLPMLRGNVFVYVSMGSELSTVAIINELKARNDARIYVPYTKDGIIVPKLLLKSDKPDKSGNLPLGCYGEECDGDIDFCITPLLGFNGRGYRIGYGLGCYDKYFACEKNAVRIGLAFDCQRVEFKNEAHDVPLDCCITESGVIYYKT